MDLYIYTTLIFPAVNCTWRWHFDCHRQKVENAIYKRGRCTSHWHWHPTLGVVEPGEVARLQEGVELTAMMPACEAALPDLPIAGQG